MSGRGVSGTALQHAAVAQPMSNLAVYCSKLSDGTVNGLCGALAGMASGIVTCPLDVIKTRLQAQGSFRRMMRPDAPTSAIYNGLIGTAKTIWTQDGVRGMYRGLGPMLLGYLPTWAVYMSIYDSSRQYYYTHVENKWLARIYASITAGACSTLATNPIWVIKTRLMSQVGSHAPEEQRPPWQYRGTIDAARKMYRAEGLRVFYSGLGPALLGLSHVAIQFPTYEFLKLQFTGLEMGQNIEDATTSHTFVGISLATFFSKVLATSATYPHEVLRTRLQTQQRTSSSDGMMSIPRYTSMIRTVQMILHEEGWRAFYNGMGTNLIRAVPAAMTTMLTFETLKTMVHNLQIESAEEHSSSLSE